jgi:hypothetical protein
MKKLVREHINEAKKAFKPIRYDSLEKHDYDYGIYGWKRYNDPKITGHTWEYIWDLDDIVDNVFYCPPKESQIPIGSADTIDQAKDIIRNFIKNK